MKITFLNGNPSPSPFDSYLTQVQTELENADHAVTRLDLRDLSLRYCIGCFGCWVKTPGECVSRDASLEMDRAIIQSDFTLWAAPLKMGFPSALLKMATDKFLPLIHPYMVVDHMEAHHLARYAHYPRFGLLMEKEAATDERDLHIVTEIYQRTALNAKSRLEFSLTTETSAVELARHITSPNLLPLPLPAPLSPTQGMTITPPSRLTLFNGSPRGRKGNTPIMLEQFAQGFGGPTEMHHLVHLKETDKLVQAFAEAECAWTGFPLYTDAMPAVVKHFIEALEPLAGRPGNPPLGFLVQSGFPEAAHSRYVERYLEKLAARLGSPYLGTIVKGGGEGIHVMPPQMTHKLFENLQTLGADLARDGRLDPEILARIASPERYPTYLWPFFQVFLRLSISHSYFDGMLKQNGAYDRRFARPFAKE
jgi:multimeric flavodoxin WrbA